MAEALGHQEVEMAPEQAGHRLVALEGELEKARGELKDARGLVEKLERRQRIDELLAESDAVDLEAARLLTEAAVQLMDEPDLRLAVDDLRRHRPYLFRQRHKRGSVMGARSETGERLEVEGEKARESGDRRTLLRYLRLKRRGE
ncbi:MAG: hypothetical protein IT442_03535 [Phycisphaeraceae bacterium]|nr:hypothetical protein [Phycisphaeraceae bacterium]